MVGSRELSARDVGEIIQVGGTFLGSTRSPEFREESGRSRAIRNLAQQGIDGVVVIGGNGSTTYARGSSHNRAFLVETMGRDCGYLAMMAGLAGGAEVISTPEFEVSACEITQRLRAAFRAWQDACYCGYCGRRKGECD
jgi:6-phosphofructokinase 1